MSEQKWNEAVITQEAAGAAYATYTTAKSVINQQNLYATYGGFFRLGRKVRVTVHMAVSNIVTTPGTMVFQVMLGTIVVWTSGNIQLNATAHTTLPAKLVVDLTCQLTNTTVNGAVAKLMGQGVLTGVMFTKTAAQTDGANTETIINVPVTTPALGAAFDSTIAQTLDFWVGFSISNAANLVQISQYDVEFMN
jgi:hypothetical protein